MSSNSVTQITLGVIDLSFHRVTASLVRHVLIDMGFTVERIYSSPKDCVSRLNKGCIDLLCSVWLPSSHGGYQSAIAEQVSITELGLHYAPYCFWGVPDYVPKSAVKEISDLLKPDVIAKMNSTIPGIHPETDITRLSIKMMKEYGLRDAGYHFFPGTEEDCFSVVERAISNKTWIVVPLWQPQFLHHKYPIRELTEPKGLLGTVERAVLLIRDDKKAYFTFDQLQRLDELRFSNNIIAALDYQICREGKSLDLVTKVWLKDNEYV